MDQSQLQIILDGITLVDLHGWAAVAAVMPFVIGGCWLAYHIAFTGDPSRLKISWGDKTFVDLHGWKASAALVPFACAMAWLAYYIAFGG